MAQSPDDKALIAEFEVFFARAQLRVPADSRDVLIEAFREMRGMLAVLREPLPPSTDTAGIFDVSSVTRGR